jgi:hypothetical protein
MKEDESASEVDDEEGTSWHALMDDENDAELAELNRRLKQRGLRSRFKVVLDDVELEWYVILDDGTDRELIDTVKGAEEVVEELCGGSL